MNYHKPTATKAQVERLAAKLNVEISDESTDSDITIAAYTPKGIRFISTGSHTAITSFDRARPGEPSNEWAGKKPEGWGLVLEDLKLGIEECTEPNCGYCERGLRNV